MDLERARLRLQLSDAELPCPMKGVIAIGRCLQLQRETAAAGKPCTCAVFRAYAGPMPEQLPDLVVVEHVDEHEEQPPPRRQKEDLEMGTQSGATDRVRAELAGEPKRWFTFAELAPVYGGSAAGCRVALNKMATAGEIERSDEGYRHDAAWTRGRGDAGTRGRGDAGTRGRGDAHPRCRWPRRPRLRPSPTCSAARASCAGPSAAPSRASSPRPS